MAGKVLLWEDRDVRFDITTQQMKMRSGEHIIDRLDSIEDTKGNSGDRGRLIVTNLRLLWHSQTMPRVSLSVGFFCVLNITTKTVNSKLRGMTEALYMLTKANNTRFEFIFTNLVPGSPRLFTSVIGVYKSYNSSRTYRELTVRSSIIQAGQLNILPHEQTRIKVNGVWNLTHDKSVLGKLIITNIRMVWFDYTDESTNISIPYIQVYCMKIRDSKFGHALVIKICEKSGGYALGFRLDPEEKLDNVYKEVTDLINKYYKQPIYGVQYSMKGKANVDSKALISHQFNDQIVHGSSIIRRSDILSTYRANGYHIDAVPLYSKELKIATKQLKELGFTLDKLLEVIHV